MKWSVPLWTLFRVFLIVTCSGVCRWNRSDRFPALPFMVCFLLEASAGWGAQSAAPHPLCLHPPAELQRSPLSSSACPLFNRQTWCWQTWNNHRRDVSDTDVFLLLPIWWFFSHLLRFHVVDQSVEWVCVFPPRSCPLQHGNCGVQKEESEEWCDIFRGRKSSVSVPGVCGARKPGGGGEEPAALLTNTHCLMEDVYTNYYWVNMYMHILRWTLKWTDSAQ